MLYQTSTIKILIISFLLAAAAASYGQLFTNALQGNSVNGVAYEDSTGDLLFATTNGLWRFDRKDFNRILIRIKTADSPEPVAINPGELTDVVFDRDKRLWVGSRIGLFVQMGAIWKHIPSDSGAPADEISDLFVDSNGRVWIGTDTDTAGVGVFDGQHWYRIKRGRFEEFQQTANGGVTTGVWVRKALLNFTRGVGPRNNRINAIFEDAAKGIWIGTDDGAPRFQGALDSASIVQQNNWCSCLNGKNVTSFAAGGDGGIWIGTDGDGVYRIQTDCASRACVRTDSLTTANSSLRNGRINDVEVDQEGNLWFGSNDGVCRYNPQVKSFRCLSDDDYPNLKIVKTIFNDSDNNLWFGMLDLQGVIRLNNNWFGFGEESLPGRFVQSLLAVEDTLWVGTTKGILLLKAEAPLGIILQDKPINALAPDESSRMWVGVYDADGGIFSYNARGDQRCYLNLDPAGKQPKRNQVNQIIQRQQEVWIAADSLLSRVRAVDCSVITTYSRESTLGGLVNDQILAIAFDKTGKLWCGTPVGVSVYDPADDKWVATFTTANGLFEDNNVTAIAVDPSNGEVWVGTANAGISIYAGMKWQHLDRRTVLADNFINKIVFSGAGEVFVATPRGVNRRDQNGLWCTFDFQSGLATDYVTSIALQGDSLRWFGTRGAGLTRYRPPQSRPQTFIETRFDVTDKSEVTYRFSAADLNTAPNEFRYRYWIDNQTPSEPTSDRFALVQGIGPGPHTFYVQAIDRDGHLDSTPDTDFFARIDPGKGGSSTHQDSTNFSKIGKVTVNIYWPPNLLSKDTEINIAADTLAKSKTSTLFAFELISNAPFNLHKPMTLTFSFPDSA
ncbi:MAG: ligand-binding sensor domain-containing protein, partial [bacterium]